MDLLVIFFADKVHIILAGIAVLYFLSVSLQDKSRLIVLGAVTLPLAYIFAKVLGIWVKTERPFSALDVAPLVPHIADNGFPSEHALYAFIIAGVIWSVHRKLGYFLMLLALLIGIARVLSLVHNPVDIVGSVVIATVVIAMVTVSPVSVPIEKLVQILRKLLLHIRVIMSKN